MAKRSWIGVRPPVVVGPTLDASRLLVALTRGPARVVARAQPVSVLRAPVRVLARIVRKVAGYVSALPRVAALVVGRLLPLRRRVSVQTLALPPPGEAS